MERGAAFLAVTAALTSGCIVTLPAEGPTREIVSVGITRIVVPERKGNLVAFRRGGLGLGFGSAVGQAAWLGFDRSEWVIADPASCQLLVVIRKDVEAANAARILESLKGENVCYAKDM